MNNFSTHELLYIKTSTSDHLSTDCVYTHYSYSLPNSIHKVLNYYLKLHFKTLELQTLYAKRILKINKLIPIYINPQVILFPIKQKRAPIQYYINARQIIGINVKRDVTVINFNNAIALEVDEPYTLVIKKCQESLILGQLITTTI